MLVSSFFRELFSRTLRISSRCCNNRLRAPYPSDGLRNVSAPALPQYPIAAWRTDESGRRRPYRRYVATTFGASLSRDSDSRSKNKDCQLRFPKAALTRKDRMCGWRSICRIACRWFFCEFADIQSHKVLVKGPSSVVYRVYLEASSKRLSSGLKNIFIHSFLWIYSFITNDMHWIFFFPYELNYL